MTKRASAPARHGLNTTLQEKLAEFREAIMADPHLLVDIVEKGNAALERQRLSAERAAARRLPKVDPVLQALTHWLEAA